MQNNPSQKELKLDLIPNQARPLQKSMVQLTGQYSPRSPQNRPSPIDLNPTAALKKSQISTKDSAISSSFITNSTNFNFTHVSPGYQPLFNRQNKKSSYLQAGTTSPALKGLLSPIKSEVRYESNPEDSLKLSKTQRSGLGGGQSKGSNLQVESAVQQIISQVKERHLPQLLSKLKKQIYDDLYNLRLEFQAFRDQTRLAIKKQEGSLLELKFLEGKAGQAGQAGQTGQTGQAGQTGQEGRGGKGREVDELAELQTNFFLLEGKISEIESRMSEHFKLNCDQFDRLEAKVSEHELKNSIGVGTIKSSLPPVLLEYRELFSVRKEGASHEVLVNSTVYHIDRMGNLLDSQNHYLVDRRGYQIRLEEKHFKLLEAHHLINY